MVAEQTPSEMNPGTKIYQPNDGGISVGDLPTLLKHYDPAADEANTKASVVPAFMKAWDTSNDSIIVTAAA